MGATNNSVKEPHATLLRSLVLAEKSISKMAHYAKQIDKKIITSFLAAIKQFICFCKKPCKNIWKDVMNSFSCAKELSKHLKKVEHPPFLLEIQKISNIVFNNYHWRCVPPVELQVAGQLLQNTLEGYMNIHPGSTDKSKNSDCGSTANSSNVDKSKNIDCGSNAGSAKKTLSANDKTILNLIERAKNMIFNIKMLIPGVQMQNFISQSAYGFHVYLIYCDTSLKYYYNLSMSSFEELPCVNTLQVLPLTTLQDLLQEIANVILFFYPKYSTPSKPVISELRGFLDVLDKMEKGWKNDLQANLGAFDNVCISVVTKINNLILKSFKGCLAPSQTIKQVVSCLIHALDAYIPCFLRATTYDCDYAKKLINKVKEFKLTGGHRAEINLMELIQALTVIAHYNYFTPPVHLQTTLVCLKVVLEEWENQWTIKNKANGTKPNDTPTVIDGASLMTLLKRIRCDVDKHTGGASKELRQEVEETVKHLQKFSAALQKKPLIPSQSNSEFLHFQQTPSSPVIPPFQFPECLPIPPTSINYLKPPSNETQFLSSKGSAKKKMRKRKKQKTVEVKSVDPIAKFAYSGKNIPVENNATNHVMMTRSKTKAAIETQISGKVSKNILSNKGNAKYSKKLVTTVPCLNSTINRFVLDEVALTKVQIQNLKSAIAKMSSNDTAVLSETLTNLLEQVKNDSFLARSTIIDMSILIKRFQTKLKGDETIIKDIVEDSFNEKFDDVLNGNDCYIERCSTFDNAFDNKINMNGKDTLKELFKFTENAIDGINAGFCKEEEEEEDDDDDEQSELNATMDINEFANSDDEDDLEESTFTILSQDEELIVELNENLIDYNAVFPVIIHQPDYDVIDLVNRKLVKYNAYMLLPDEDEHSKDYESKLKLEFPSVATFVDFVEDNKDLVRTLKLVTKEKDGDVSIPHNMNDLNKTLNEQCKAFLQTKENIEEQVENQIKVFETCMKSTVVKDRVLRDLETEIQSVFTPNCKLHVFGSRASGLAVPDSDFDIYCDVTGDAYFRGVTYDKQKSFVFKLGNQLRKNSAVFSHILSLVGTKVPIVKLFHKPTGLNCDISFKNGISVENTRLLKFYLGMDDRVRWVLTAVKLWANYNEITGSRYFTNHGISWLVIFYLMHVGIVPPVMELQKSCQPKIIDDWNVAFKTPEEKKPKVEATGLDLLKGFFSWVAESDLTADCYTTVLGEAVSKELCHDFDWLEKHGNGVFREYAQRLKVRKPRQKNRVSSYDPIEHNVLGLCVQDPFEFNKNVVKSVNDLKYETFIRLSKETDCILKTITKNS